MQKTFILFVIEEYLKLMYGAFTYVRILSSAQYRKYCAQNTPISMIYNGDDTQVHTVKSETDEGTSRSPKEE